MKIAYSRIPIEGKSKEDTPPDIQFDKVLIDRCSASIPLWERTKGREIRRLLSAGVLKEFHIPFIGMLGHDINSVMLVWKELTESHVRVVCKTPAFENIDADGNTTGSSQLLLSILMVIEEMTGSIQEEERQLLRKKQKEGVKRAKAEGKYKGRKRGSTESVDKFLRKPKTIEILNDLSNGLTVREISTLRECSNSTVYKVMRLNEERKLTVGKVVKMITEIQDPQWIETLSDEEKEQFLKWEWLIMEKLKLSKNPQLLASLSKLQDALSGMKELEQVSGIYGMGTKIERNPSILYKAMIDILPKGQSKFTTRKRKPVHKKDGVVVDLMTRYFGESRHRCTEYYEILKELGQLEKFRVFILRAYGESPGQD